MDLTLPDLCGWLRESRMDPQMGVAIPTEWLDTARDVPFCATFGLSPVRQPIFLVVRLNSQPHWAFVREQFPSLRKVEGVGRYTMDEADYAKMRLLYGGEW